MKKRKNRVVPSLLVNDMEETIGFYKKLGFRLTGMDDVKNPGWIECTFDEAVIQFYSDPPVDTPEKPILSGTIYLYTEDVKELAEQFRDQVSFEWGPEEMEYGMFEFGIRDPNGYLLAFAEPVTL